MEFSKLSLRSERSTLFNIESKELGKKLLNASVVLKKPPILKRKTVNGVSDDDTLLNDEYGTVTEEMILGIYTDIPELQLKVTRRLRKMLTDDQDPPIDEMINSGLIPKLVTFLSQSSEMLQYEAAWVLTNIAGGSSLQTRYVIEAGAVPPFIKLLYSNAVNIQEQVLWALANISGDSPEFREHVLDCGIIPPLNKLVQHTNKISTLRLAAWTLSNLCRGKSNFSKLKKCLPSLEYLVMQDDGMILADTFWTISFLCDGDGERIDFIIEANLLSYIVDRLNRDDSIVHPALQIIGNLCLGTDNQTESVLQYKILERLIPYANCANESIQRQVCWIISNIVAGPTSHIQAVVESDIMSKLLIIMTNGSLRSKREVVWAIKNISSNGLPIHTKYLLSNNVITHLCNILIENDKEILIIALAALENFLITAEEEAKNNGNYNIVAVKIEESNGVDKIEHLQSHEEMGIYRKAYEIMETYFSYIEPSISCGDGRQLRYFP